MNASTHNDWGGCFQKSSSQGIWEYSVSLDAVDEGVGQDPSAVEYDKLIWSTPDMGEDRKDKGPWEVRPALPLLNWPGIWSTHHQQYMLDKIDCSPYFIEQ